RFKATPDCPVCGGKRS
ncbi:MAG: hypothetical protein HQL11_04360, partial [Candidatus Omnitrophica bacterium]|nr:hypothetical protein [Candidatus Omnitrophota bacterium]